MKKPKKVIRKGISMKILKWIPLFILIFSVGSFMGCTSLTGTVPGKSALPNQYELIVKVEGGEGRACPPCEGKVNKSMEIANPEGTLSNLSFIIGNEAFVKLFSSLTIGDTTRLWGDLWYLKEKTSIRYVHLFINSPGGDAFNGMALSDIIEEFTRDYAFAIVAHASGIIASAAVPVLAVCTKRIASPGTIFMVHEASIWKWPGRETHSDIRAQKKLMDLLRDRYLKSLAEHTKITEKEWGDMEKEITWFDTQRALEIGLIDKIK